MQYGYSLVVLFVAGFVTLVSSLPLHDVGYSNIGQYGALNELSVPVLLDPLLLRNGEYMEHVSPRTEKRNIAIGRGDGFRPGK
ncbi:unnamed protein product [Toxocara canis]|uniref:Uncharacterized protein n=1 Tax=Toxocara canis TaxID=6265 RepID=A0A183UUZ2_TOXCA|nr:unnamed protein product [Toxocara canis]